jgi:hypothetical protein
MTDRRNLGSPLAAAREPGSLHLLARVLRAARLGEGLPATRSCRRERSELRAHRDRLLLDRQLGVTF